MRTVIRSLAALLLCIAALGCEQKNPAKPENATPQTNPQTMVESNTPATPEIAADGTALYQKNGLAFSMPQDWKVTEDVSRNGARYLFVEPPGNAVVVVNVFTKARELGFKEYVNNMIDEAIKETTTANRTRGSLTEVQTPLKGHNFHGYRNDFSITLATITVPHTQTFYDFATPTQTAYVSFQAANEDMAAVKEGFDLVLSTFKIE